jgi:hypothetical protein
MPPNFGDLNVALQYVMHITDLYPVLYNTYKCYNIWTAYFYMNHIFFYI